VQPFSSEYLIFHPLSKSISIKINYNFTGFFSVRLGLVLREEHRLRMFEN
jgi:hypothetical protein